MKIYALPDYGDSRPENPDSGSWRLIGTVPGVDVEWHGTAASRVGDILVDLLAQFSGLVKRHGHVAADRLVNGPLKAQVQMLLEMEDPVLDHETGKWIERKVPTGSPEESTPDYSYMIGKTYDWMGVRMTVTGVSVTNGQPVALVDCVQPSGGHWKKLQPLPFPDEARVDDDALDPDEQPEVIGAPVREYYVVSQGGERAHFLGVDDIEVTPTGILWVKGRFDVFIAGYAAGAWRSFGVVK